MTNTTHRSEIVLPDFAEFYTASRAVRRNAEVARAVYLHDMIGNAFRKVGTVLRRWADVLNFAQRMNQDARL